MVKICRRVPWNGSWAANTMSAIATFWLSCCCGAVAANGRRRRRRAGSSPLSRRRSNPFSDCVLCISNFVSLFSLYFRTYFNFGTILLLLDDTHTHREAHIHCKFNKLDSRKQNTNYKYYISVCLPVVGRSYNPSSSVGEPSTSTSLTLSSSFQIRTKGCPPGSQMWLEFRELCPRTSKSRHYSNWNKRQLIGTTWEWRT